MTSETNDPILLALAEKRAEKLRNKISVRLRAIANRVERELKDLQVPGEPKPVFALFVMAAGAAQYIGNGGPAQIKQIVGSVLQRLDDPAYTALHKPLHEKSPEEFQAEKDDPL